MPPEDADSLTDDEVRNFVAWVKLGAPYPGDSGTAPALKPSRDLAKARQFWSLRPVAKPTPPPVEPSSWPRNPIDQFVLAKLNAAQLPSSPPADKPALLRRATYTLTGLPPTPAEIDAFLADASPDAFSKVVERLLGSRHYGVHWARHWFDVARYGDTRWVGAGEDRRWPFAYTYRYFDFPGADGHVAERHETIVARQALYLMNNGFVMEQAAHVARLSATIASGSSAGEDPATRLDQLYRLILGRNPSASERTLGLDFIQSQPAPISSANSATNGAANSATNILTKVATNAPADLWRCGTGTYDEDRQRVTNFEPFPFVAGNQWKGGPLEVDPMLGRASLNARGGFAGPTGELATIRRWIVPRPAHLSITGQLSIQLNSTQPLGDGVRARIISSRRGKLGEWIVHGTEETTEINDVPVEQDDTIDFVVDARGRDQHANFAWAPVICLEPPPMHPDEKLIWDAAKDFKTPATAPAPAFDAWERLAQVLLEANEFMFLD